MNSAVDIQRMCCIVDSSMHNETITVLKRVRTEKQWSQREAAKKCGIDHGNFHRIENGELAVSAEDAQEIALAFGMPVRMLFRPSRYAANEEAADLEAKAS